MSDAFSVIASVDQALALAGARSGPTDWVLVDQAMITAFGATTGDLQWIHVDPTRAASGPFGKCIAHGLLTLALAGGQFFHQLVRTSAKAGVNYGCDRARYPAPVPVGSRLRATAEITAVQQVDLDGVQMTVRVAVEIEAQQRPACVADFVVRYHF